MKAILLALSGINAIAIIVIVLFCIGVIVSLADYISKKK